MPEAKLNDNVNDVTSYSSASSSTENAADLHNYNGFDEHTEARIQKLARTLTAQSMQNSTQSAPNKSDAQSIFSSGVEGVNPIFSDPEAPGYDPKLDPNSENFSSAAWVKNMAHLSAADPDFYKPYSLGCAWKNLSASGASADVAYQSTVVNIPYKILKSGLRKFQRSKETNTFQILKPMDGCLNPGELLVVLGRPGSGCTTLLKSISSNTHGFDLGADTKISYSGYSGDDIKKHFRGEVVYNAEADVHLPHLTVFETLVTIARLKTPQNRIKGVDRESYANHLAEVAMATYGLSHTRNTKVGNDIVRGVSGGERKRVSIAEVSICGSKFQCWDNATRGLDSATALEFIRALKTQADISNTSATVAIYQCSQDAYDLFNKVCVLDDGYQIYYGPADKAKKYFEDMGYVCPSRQTTADFLTSVTSPSERTLNKDMLKKGIHIPQTPKEMNDYWIKSPNYKELMKEVDQRLLNDDEASREAIKEAHIAKQSKRARPSSPYTVSYMMQVKYLLIRNMWRLRNNIGFTLFMILGNCSMALILGSMFFKIMKKGDTSTFYFRGSPMFFAILFNAFSSLLEIFSLYEARPITEKHRTYSLYHPSADAFASVYQKYPQS